MASLHAGQRAGFEAAVERVIAADRDDELYLGYLREPDFPGNTLTPYADASALQRFLFRVIDDLPHFSLARARRQAAGWLARGKGYARESAGSFYRRLIPRGGEQHG